MSILVKQKVLRWGLAPFTAGSMVSLNNLSTNWQINGHICFTVWGGKGEKWCGRKNIRIPHPKPPPEPTAWRENWDWAHSTVGSTVHWYMHLQLLEKADSYSRPGENKLYSVYFRGKTHGIIWNLSAYPLCLLHYINLDEMTAWTSSANLQRVWISALWKHT